MLTPLLTSTDCRHPPGLCQGYGLPMSPGGPSPIKAPEALACAPACYLRPPRGSKEVLSQLSSSLDLSFLLWKQRGRIYEFKVFGGHVEPHPVLGSEVPSLALILLCGQNWVSVPDQLLLVPCHIPWRCSARGLYSLKKPEPTSRKGCGERLEEELRPLVDSLVTAVTTDQGSASPAL